MTEPGSTRPPQLAEAILGKLIGTQDLRDAIVGDLAEDFARIATTRSVGAARTWYWSQVLRSVGSLSWLSVMRGVAPWLESTFRFVVPLVMGYAVFSALLILGDKRLEAIFGVDGVALLLMSPLSLVIGVPIAFVIGCLVAVVVRSKPFLTTLAIGLAYVTVAAPLIRVDEAFPILFQLTMVVIIVPAMLVGTLAWMTVRPKRGPGTPSP